MADVELKNLSRKDLLRLLLLQSERVKELEQMLAVLEAKLEEDNIMIDTAGSICEAAKVLENVFADAEYSVTEYIENIKKHNDSIDVIIRKREAESRAIADKMIEESLERCRLREEQAKKELDMLWSHVRGTDDTFDGSDH